MDQHLHLSGALPINFFWLLYGDKIPAEIATNFEEFKTKIQNFGNTLEDFLTSVHILDKIQSHIPIRDQVRDAFLNNENGTQIRFNPIKRIPNYETYNYDDLEEKTQFIVERSIEALEIAKKCSKKNSALILCMGRDLSLFQNEIILRTAIKFKTRGIIGIDLAGQYDWRNRDSYDEFYKTAKKYRLITTIHAGEEFSNKTEEELEWVLNTIKPDRIGHGIQIYRYPKLVKLALKQKISFEICPSSNFSINAITPHNLYLLLSYFLTLGISFNICTDSRTLLDTTLLKENKKIKDIFIKYHPINDYELFFDRF